MELMLPLISGALVVHQMILQWANSLVEVSFRVDSVSGEALNLC